MFHPRYNNVDTGRPAYGPAILLKIIRLAYFKDITSSREIEGRCQNSIIFKALSCDSVPQFTTIADFVSGRSEEIEAIFEHILLICDEQGLLGHELFEIDDCKMSCKRSHVVENDTVDELGHHKLRFEGPVSKCRHCHLKQHCIRNPESPNGKKEHGRQVSFILERAKRKFSNTDWMKHRVDSEKGRQVYCHRRSIVEPVFGNISTNKWLNRFSLRGTRKVQGQW